MAQAAALEAVGIEGAGQDLNQAGVGGEGCVPARDAHRQMRRRAAGAFPADSHDRFGEALAIGRFAGDTLRQNTTGFITSPEAHDEFGASLALGDMDSRFGVDLAVGAPGENWTANASTHVDQGTVHLFFGGRLLVTPLPSKNTWLRNGSVVKPGLPKTTSTAPASRMTRVGEVRWSSSGAPTARSS